MAQYQKKPRWEHKAPGRPKKDVDELKVRMHISIHPVIKQALIAHYGSVAQAISQIPASIKAIEAFNYRKENNQ